MAKAKAVERIGANVRGYLACLLDQSGSASYNEQQNRLTLTFNRTGDPRLQADLKAWMGGYGSFSETENQRRGCTIHCKHKHIHYTRRSSRWVITGTRAIMVLYTLQDSMRTWDRFAPAYHRAVDAKSGYPQDVFDEMLAKGWDAP